MDILGHARFGLTRLAILHALVAVFLPLAAYAGETSLGVAVTVSKRAALTVVAQPSFVVVTPADIAHGYVDVPVPAQVAIQTNSRDGYLLEFASHGDFMRQILVRGLGNDVQMSAGGGVVARAASFGQGVTRTTLNLAFRFVLSESAREGTYPWPMRLSVAPI